MKEETKIIIGVIVVIGILFCCFTLITKPKVKEIDITELGITENMSNRIDNESENNFPNYEMRAPANVIPSGAPNQPLLISGGVMPHSNAMNIINSYPYQNKSTSGLSFEKY